jgi:hypothetical protein
VAVFFSLAGDSLSGKRALWALLEADIETINKGRTRSSQLKIVSPLSHHNPRLVTQRGLFLEVPLGESVEGLVTTAKNTEWITMYKITYPDAIRNDALSALNNMNINYASLFPDLAGASLNTNYLLEAEPYLESQRHSAFSDAQPTSASGSDEN